MLDIYQKPFHIKYQLEAFDCVDHNKLWQVLKEMGVPDHLISWETYTWDRKQQLELDMEQLVGSK